MQYLLLQPRLGRSVPAFMLSPAFAGPRKVVFRSRVYAHNASNCSNANREKTRLLMTAGCLQGKVCTDHQQSSSFKNYITDTPSLHGAENIGSEKSWRTHT